METTPPSNELQFFLTLLLKHLLATHVSYDRAFKAISLRYNVPKWLTRTFYKVGWYFTVYYYGIRWLSAKNGYGVNPAGMAAYFASLGFSVKELKRRLRSEAKGLSLSKRISIQYGYPEYLVRDLLGLMDRGSLEKMLRRMNERKRWIRINTLKTSIDDALNHLESRGFIARRSKALEYMAYIEHPKWSSLGGLDLVSKGLVIPQDLASALSIDILVGRGIHSILDACSAPGNKLSQYFMLTGNKAFAVAVDKSMKRLRTEINVLRTLAVDLARVVFINADSASLKISGDAMEMAIIDAPCSGTGAVSSDPAIKLSIMRKDKLRYYHELQYSITKNILENGVKLVGFITCSIHPLEGEMVIDRLIEEGLAEPVKLKDPRLFSAYPGFKSSDSAARIMPYMHDSQGFFLALLRNKKRR